MKNEFARGLLFVLISGSIFAGAVAILIHRLVRRFISGQRKDAPRALTWLEKAVLGIAAWGVCCVVYGRFLEPRWLAVTHTVIASRKLSASAAPLKIAHLSDLHAELTTTLELEVVRKLQQERPDVIVFSGDSLNSADALPVFRRWLRSVSQIAPTFVVKGNWDAWYWHELPLFADSGAIELDGTAVRIMVHGTPLWLAGVAVGHEARAAQALQAVSPDEETIFLYHYPYPDVVPADRKVDLLCAGHVHGGQLALPFYGALVTLSKYGKQYEAGLYQVASMAMYVSRGIGMEGGSMPRVRFFSRPELAMLQLQPATPTNVD